MPRRILQLAEGAAQTVKRIPEADLGTVVVGFTAALPEAHPMATLGRQLTLNDLDGQDVIMFSPMQARYFNELLISTFTIAGATPRYSAVLTQVHTMLVLVRSGIGIALVSASAATLHPDGVVFAVHRRISGAPSGARCGMAG